MGWRRFLRRSWWDDERARELQAHLDLETDENLARGMTPAEARAAALRKLGDPARIREDIYAMNTVGVVDRLVQDVRYGVRVLARSPGFTTAAVLTLALGIGGVTIIYSVIRNVLLDPFPYTDSRRMIDLFVVDTASNGRRGALRADEFLDYQEQSDVFDGVIGTISARDMPMPAHDGADSLSVCEVTPNAFEFLGVGAALGRGIVPSDGAPASAPIVVLSHGAWVDRFGADPGVIGRAITLDDQVRTVVGVMPPRFTWHVADAWIARPLRRGDADAASRQWWFQARLARGVSLAQAEAQMNVIAARRAPHHPGDYPPQFRMSVITVIDFVVGRFRFVLYTLFGAVGLLLLIACSNVANMLLARATAREREFTLRGALGASRSRLMSQLMLESLLLALAGAAAGCLVAYGGLKMVAHYLPRQGVPYEVVLRLDRWALLFSLVTAVGTALVFGLLPAWHASRRDLAEGLKGAGRGKAGMASYGRVRSGLIVGEVALSLLLLLGAGLTMRSFLAMVQTDLGIPTSGIAVAVVRFPTGGYEAAALRHHYYHQAARRLRAAPGIAATGVGSHLPVGGLDTTIERPGREHAAPRDGEVILCDEGYFRTFDLGAIRGRLLTAADLSGARPVAVISQALALRFFGSEDPLGQPIRLKRLAETPAPMTDPTFEVVGVVADVRNRGLNAPGPAVYVPSTVVGWGSRLVVARIPPDRALALETIRRELKAVDRNVSVRDVVSLEEEVNSSYAQPRFSLIVLGAFAGVGLLLVGIGVYGVMAYVVSLRTREIAIRMALGADRRDMLRSVLRSGAALLAAGIVVGLPVSVATSRLLPVAEGVAASTYDPWTTAAGVSVITIVGLVACLVPALRASRVDPMIALRQD